MLRKARATWPLAGSPRAAVPPARSRGSASGIPGWPGTVRPVSAAGT